MSRPFSIAHWQALVRNPESAATFYQKCFGWQVDDANSLGYRSLQSSGLPGGIWPIAEGSPRVQLFIAVPNIDVSLGSIEANGGRILLAKQILPDGDEMAIIADPQDVSWGLLRTRDA